MKKNESVDSHISELEISIPQQTAVLAASLYHEQSKRFPQRWVGMWPTSGIDESLLRACSERAYKEYPSKVRHKLLPPQSLETVTLNQLILDRRSIRSFSGKPMSLQSLSTLFALSYRVIPNNDQNIKVQHPSSRRPVPSGGALYPLELYLVIKAVDELGSGIYHYHPVLHSLELLDNQNTHLTLDMCIDNLNIPDGWAALVNICGVLPRTCFKYGELGYRLMLIEAGHVAQNILLVAQALQLSCLPSCGFYDDLLHSFLGIDGFNEVCLYQIWIGHNSFS